MPSCSLTKTSLSPQAMGLSPVLPVLGYHGYRPGKKAQHFRSTGKR